MNMTNVEIVYPGPRGPVGPVGPRGPSGPPMLTGSGAPTSELGEDGDSYFDTVTGQIYTKVDGVWIDTGSSIYGTTVADIEADADRAEAAADEAEAARDAAIADAGIYPNTAAGLAAVGEGGYFFTPGATSADPMKLYQDVGGTAVLVATYPSGDQMQEAVDTNADLLARMPRDEYAVYIQNDGSGVIPEGGYPMTRSATKVMNANHLHFEITSSTGASSCKVTIRVAAVVHAGAPVVFGTPFIQNDANVPVAVGNPITVEISDVVGSLQGIWVQMDGENT